MDIAFGGDSGKPLLLDVYRPREGEGPLPVLLYVHGGGWTMGSKNVQGLKCAAFDLFKTSLIQGERH